MVDDQIVKMFGADALRLTRDVRHAGPLDAREATASLPGRRRVVRSATACIQPCKRASLASPSARRPTSSFTHVKKVTNDIESVAFNTAISQMMVYTNHLHVARRRPHDAVVPLILLVFALRPAPPESCR
ncbi:MAG: hypothetical protein R3B70_33935 [Polyangiaceae bacterium]